MARRMGHTHDDVRITARWRPAALVDPFEPVGYEVLIVGHRSSFWHLPSIPHHPRTVAWRMHASNHEVLRLYEERA